MSFSSPSLAHLSQSIESLNVRSCPTQDYINEKLKQLSKYAKILATYQLQSLQKLIFRSPSPEVEKELKNYWFTSSLLVVYEKELRAKPKFQPMEVKLKMYLNCFPIELLNKGLEKLLTS